MIMAPLRQHLHPLGRLTAGVARRTPSWNADRAQQQGRPGSICHFLPPRMAAEDVTPALQPGQQLPIAYLMEQLPKKTT